MKAYYHYNDDIVIGVVVKNVPRTDVEQHQSMPLREEGEASQRGWYCICCSTIFECILTFFIECWDVLSLYECHGMVVHTLNVAPACIHGMPLYYCTTTAAAAITSVVG